MAVATELFIPKLGQTVEEVTLINWLVEDGSKVEIGSPVMDVETDKAVFPVEANDSGYIHFGPFQSGQVIPVLTVVAIIGKVDDVFIEITASSDKSFVVDQTTAQSSGVAPASASIPGDSIPRSVSQTGKSDRLFISPRARKLADEKHADLSQVKPTGGGGIRIVERDVLVHLTQSPKATPVAANMAHVEGVLLNGIKGTGINDTITKEDVQRTLRQKTSLPAQPTVETGKMPLASADLSQIVPLTGVRKIIFERMGTSVHTTARVTLVTEVDATDLVKVRENIKEKESKAWGFSVGYNDLIGFIVANTLHEFHYMNARVSADAKSIEYLARINLGIAVDTPRGLMVPVIQDADKKSLRVLGSEFRQMADRALAGKSLLEDFSGGTFTITNLGIYDIDAFTPVINLPEAAILGVGRIHEKVVPFNAKIEIRNMLSLSLVFDHRLNDGAPAARFLQRIKNYIENPSLLLA